MDHVYKFSMTALGGIIGYLWGGWSALLGILLAFAIIDYMTGLIAAGVEGKLSSSVGFRGIAKKILIFVLVAVGHLLDKALGGQNDMFRDATIFFFLANELLSIIENAGRAGVPIPQILQNAVEVLKGRDGK